MRLTRHAPVWGAVMLLGACAQPTAPAEERPAFSVVQVIYATNVESEICRLTDQARALNGNLSALQPYREFRAIARTHSRAMAAQGRLVYFSTRGLRVGQRVVVGGNAFRYVGRNVQRIAPGLYAANLALYDTQSGWLNQPGPRANLLSPTAYAVGVGAYRGADGYLYITQAFFEQLL